MTNKKALETLREGYRQSNDYKEARDLNDKLEAERVALMKERVNKGEATAHEYLALGYEASEAKVKARVKESEGVQLNEGINEK